MSNKPYFARPTCEQTTFAVALSKLLASTPLHVLLVEHTSTRPSLDANPSTIRTLPCGTHAAPSAAGRPLEFHGVH